jgi:hypothetical protein
MNIPFVIEMSFTTISTYDSIRIGRENITLRPWRRGGGSEVAGAGDAGVSLAVAADAVMKSAARRGCSELELPM